SGGGAGIRDAAAPQLNTHPAWGRGSRVGTRTREGGGSGDLTAAFASAHSAAGRAPPLPATDQADRTGDQYQHADGQQDYRGGGPWRQRGEPVGHLAAASVATEQPDPEPGEGCEARTPHDRRPAGAGQGSGCRGLGVCEPSLLLQEREGLSVR